MESVQFWDAVMSIVPVTVTIAVSLSATRIYHLFHDFPKHIVLIPGILNSFIKNLLLNGSADMVFLL